MAANMIQIFIILRNNIITTLSAIIRRVANYHFASHDYIQYNFIDHKSQIIFNRLYLEEAADI